MWAGGSRHDPACGRSGQLILSQWTHDSEWVSIYIVVLRRWISKLGNYHQGQQKFPTHMHREGIADKDFPSSYPMEMKGGQFFVFQCWPFWNTLCTISRIWKNFCILDASVVNWDFQWCKWKLDCWILFTFTGKEDFTSKAQSGENPFWNDPCAFVQVFQSLGQSYLTLLGTG